MFSSIGFAQPDACHEVGGLCLKGIEVTVKRQQHKGVFLRVVPAPGGAIGQQPGHYFRDQIALRLILDQRIEDNRIGAAAGVEQQVGLFAIRGGKVGGPRGLNDAIVDLLADRLDLLGRGRIAAQHLPDPGNRFERLFFQALFVKQVARLSGVDITHQRPYIERISAEAVAHRLTVPIGIVVLDVAQVVERPAHHLIRHVEVFHTRPLQGMGDMDAVVGHRLIALGPDRPAAIAILQLLQPRNIALHRGRHRFRGR